MQLFKQKKKTKQLFAGFRKYIMTSINMDGKAVSLCEASAQMPLTELHATLKGSGSLLFHILCVGLIIFLALSGGASRLDQISSSAVLRRLLSQFSAYENKASCFFFYTPTLYFNCLK